MHDLLEESAGVQRPLWYSTGWLAAVLELLVGLPLGGYVPAFSAGNNTTVTGFWVRNATHGYLALSSYRCGEPSPMPSSGQLLNITLQGARFTSDGALEYTLHPGNSVYDALYRNLSATGMLAYADGQVYPLGTMATADGLQWVCARSSSFFAMQAQAFQAQGFAGKVVPGEGSTRVELLLPTQATVLVALRAAP
jgi:hypothetical protein